MNASSRHLHHGYNEMLRTQPRKNVLALALLGLLGGLPASAWAQESTANLQCTGDACTKDGQTVIRLVSRGETESTDPAETAMQVERRVEVSQTIPGRTSNTVVSLDVPGGGKIWATEDPQLASPQLTMSAPGYVAFADGRVVKPVSFNLYSNYSAFIDRIELLIYRSQDSDLLAPLAKVDVPVAAQATATWSGEMSVPVPLHEGEDLQYIVRAYSADGSVDETIPRKIQLLRPADVQRLQSNLRASTFGELSGLSAEEIQQRQQVEESFGQNSLRQQNIRVSGSRIRVRGVGLAEGAQVRINGQQMPIDRERKFVAEYLLPIGEHKLLVETTLGGKSMHRELPIQVSGHYLFVVALADVTVSDNQSVAPWCRLGWTTATTVF